MEILNLYRQILEKEYAIAKNMQKKRNSLCYVNIIKAFNIKVIINK